MDFSSFDYNGPTTSNFDMELLTSMTNTDLLIRLIKDQAEETAALKSQLSSFNSSAMQMKNCYTAEKQRNDHIERENRQLQTRLKTMEERNSLLNDNLLNNTAVYEQKSADMENQHTLLCRHLITQRNILRANHLSPKESHQHYSNAKEFLRKRGEIVVDDVRIISKKKQPAKANAATMTEQCDISKPKEVKTFCDKSTMHCPMVSTATRGTTTSTFIKTVDVATNFPEPLAIDVDEIFRIMIDDMPPAITPIDDLPLQSKYSQTEPAPQSNCSVGTVTRIRNVRRKINYASENSRCSTPTSNPPYRVKKEKEDSISDLLNLDYRNDGQSSSPINQKLTQLWQMVGQMIFSIIGNGEVFNHSTNVSLINDNLNQIRRVIEMESNSETQFQNIDDFVEEPLDDHFAIAVDVPGFGAATSTTHNNATITSHSGNVRSPHTLPHVDLLINPTQANASQALPHVDLPINPTQTNASETLPHADLPINPTQTNASQTCQKEFTSSPRIKIHNYTANDVPSTADSAIQCEPEVIFKKPSSGSKRKLPVENCMVRKRTCQRKMFVQPKPSQVNEKSEEKSIRRNSSPCGAEPSTTPNDRTEPSTSMMDDPDSSLVEDILRYYKMPKFVETITDSSFVIEAMKRLSASEERTSNAQSNNLESKVLESEELDISLDVSSTDSNSNSNGVEESTSRSQNVTIGPSDLDQSSSLPSNVLESQDLESIDLPSTDTMASTYDEFDSPASPPPFNACDSSYHPPLNIPSSPKKLNHSVVKQILANFNKPKRLALRQRKFKVPTEEEQQILVSTRCRIEKYLASEWATHEIDACCNDLSNIRASVLSKCLVEVVANTKNENVSNEFTPPAPALPKTQQKVIVLIKRINQLVNGFEDLVLFQLEKVMFALAHEKVSISEGENLTHLFIGLTDCADDDSKWSCVLFLYKCLYYFAIKAIPMVYSVLMTYPTLLPKFQEGEDVADFLKNTDNILQATFVVVLINTNLCEFNTGKLNSDTRLRKRDLSTFLKAYYRFPCMKPTTDDFVDILLNRLATSSNLENILYSLILIAKRNGTVWAEELVQRKLLPQLNRFLSTIADGPGNDDRIALLVSAISSIIKTFPITKDISNYQQLFYKILDLTTRQSIQEEAVMALLRTSRFGMVDVYKRICDWQPQTPVRRQCHSMLSTFLYRQNLSYWQNF